MPIFDPPVRLMAEAAAITNDVTEYKRRSGVECGNSVLKQWRGIATRYDKHALTYRGAVVLASILTWTR